MAHTNNPTHLDERVVHMAVKLLLPTTLEYHDDTQEWETTTWSESCDALGEWEDREGCSTDFLLEHDAFDGMASRDLAPVTAAAMRLIRDMGRDRAVIYVWAADSNYTQDHAGIWHDEHGTPVDIAIQHFYAMEAAEIIAGWQS